MFHQLVRHDPADAFDVECTARSKKFDASRRLCRALKNFAAPGNELRVAANRTATDRTLAVNVFDKIERLRIARPFSFHPLDNSRDDFASLFNHYGVADA